MSVALFLRETSQNSTWPVLIWYAVLYVVRSGYATTFTNSNVLLKQIVTLHLLLSYFLT